MPQPRDVLLRVGGANLKRARELLAQSKKKVGSYDTIRDLLDAALTRGLDDIRVELAEAVSVIYEEQHRSNAGTTSQAREE